MSFIYVFSFPTQSSDISQALSHLNAEKPVHFIRLRRLYLEVLCTTVLIATKFPLDDTSIYCNVTRDLRRIVCDTD